MIYTDVTSRALTYLLKRPGLHIDMTESIYRGLAEIRYGGTGWACCSWFTPIPPAHRCSISSLPIPGRRRKSCCR